MKKAGIILIMVLTILGITGLAYFANKKDKLSSSINNTNYEIEKSATQINNIAQNETSNITPNMLECVYCIPSELSVFDKYERTVLS